MGCGSLLVGKSVADLSIDTSVWGPVQRYPEAEPLNPFNRTPVPQSTWPRFILIVFDVSSQALKPTRRSWDEGRAWCHLKILSVCSRILGLRGCPEQWSQRGTKAGDHAPRQGRCWRHSFWITGKNVLCIRKEKKRTKGGKCANIWVSEGQLRKDGIGWQRWSRTISLCPEHSPLGHVYGNGVTCQMCWMQWRDWGKLHFTNRDTLSW